MKLLWSLSYKGKCVRLCWIPSHCGIGGMKLRTISKRGPWPRHNPTDQCPLYKFEATGQFWHSALGSNQMGCSLTWHKYISLGTNTGAIEQFPALNQSWRSCNHPTLSWPYRSHQVPCPVPRTTDCFSPLWPNTDRAHPFRIINRARQYHCRLCKKNETNHWNVSYAGNGFCEI